MQDQLSPDLVVQPRGVPLPTYGNYGGNGANDAWLQADRYLTFQRNGYNPMFYIEGYGTPEASMMDPADFPMQTGVSLARTQENRDIVRTLSDKLAGRRSMTWIMPT